MAVDTDLIRRIQLARERATLSGERTPVPQIPRTAGGGDEDRGFIQNLISSITKPVIGFGRSIGETGAATLAVGAGALGDREIPLIGGTGKELEQALFEGLAESENFQQLAQDPLQTVGRQAAGTGALVTPIGGGLRGLALGGAVSGGLFAASEEEAGLADIATGAVTGGVAGPVLSKVGSGLTKIVGKGASSVVEPALELGRKIKDTPVVRNFLGQFTLKSKMFNTMQVDDIADTVISDGLATGRSTVDLGQVAQRITGRDGIITKIRRNAIAGAEKDVDTSAAKSVMDNMLDSSPNIVDSVEKKVARVLNKTLRRGQDIAPAVGEDFGKLNPLETFTAISKIKQLARQAKVAADKVGGDLKNDELEVVYNAVAAELTDSLDQVVSAAAVEAAKTTVIMESLEKLSKPLADRVRKAVTPSALSRLEAPYVGLDIMVETSRAALLSPIQTARSTTLLSLDIPTELAKTFLGPGKITNTAIGLANNIKKPIAAAAGGARALRTGIRESINKIPGPIKPAVLKALTLTAADVTTSKKEESVFDEFGLDTQQSAELSLREMQTVVQEREYQRISNEIAILMIANPDNADTIKNAFDMWSQANNPYNNLELSSTERQAVADARIGAAMVEGMSTDLEALGLSEFGPLALVGGTAKLALSKINRKELKAYEDTRQAMATTMARAFGEGSRPSDRDIERFVKIIPTVTDTRESAQIKWDNVRRLMSDKEQQTISVARQFGGEGAGVQTEGLDISQTQQIFEQGGF